MSKSVYSLVLSDEIVAEIDGLAARSGTSRSALINRILAEYASVPTVEHRSRAIAQEIERVASGAHHTSVSPTGMLTIRSLIRYKYNPTILYVIDIEESDVYFGELRVGLRSQNQGLLQKVAQFFTLWMHWEKEYLDEPPSQEEAAVDEVQTRYRRVLRRKQDAAQGALAGAGIAAYIDLMDGCLQLFFEEKEPSQGMLRAEKRYREQLNELGWVRRL